MEQAKNLGQLALWLSGHLLFTLITVCTLRGGYQFYHDYQEIAGTPINVSELTDDSKQALANALIDDGFSVPRNIDDKGKKRG